MTTTTFPPFVSRSTPDDYQHLWRFTDREQCADNANMHAVEAQRSDWIGHMEALEELFDTIIDGVIDRPHILQAATEGQNRCLMLLQGLDWTRNKENHR